MPEPLILLPGMPGFYQILATPPPDPTKQLNFVARSGQFGILEAVADKELDEYLEGGEYSERLEEIGEAETIEEFGLYLPDSISVSTQSF